MLKIGSIKQVKASPKIINPLSVSENLEGKKHLHLDLRYINRHLYKDKIKFDDWKFFENDLEYTGGYYHADVIEEHHTYMGFS